MAACRRCRPRAAPSTPLFSDTAADDEREGRVSPDGKRIAYVSDRQSEDGDVDLWVADLSPGPRDRVNRTRVARVRGLEGFPSWSPDATRLAFFAVREGLPSVWVASIDDLAGGADQATVTRPRPATQPVLVSRRGGMPAWSPDGRRIAIAQLPPPEPTYNGNPERNGDDPPPLFAGPDAFRLWTVDAPLPVDSGAREVVTAAPRPEQLTAAFDRVWETLRRLYYRNGPSSTAWQELRTTVPAAGAGGEGRGGCRIGDRFDDRRAAADQAARGVAARRRRVWPSARVTGRRHGARTRREHRRCGDCRVVRPRCRRARSVRNRGRRHGGGVPERDVRAGRRRIQGSGADSRDAGQPRASGEYRRRSVRGEHAGRGGRAGHAVPEVRQPEARRGPS